MGVGTLFNAITILAPILNTSGDDVSRPFNRPKRKKINDVQDVGKRNPHEEVRKLGVGNAVMNGEPQVQRKVCSVRL